MTYSHKVVRLQSFNLETEFKAISPKVNIFESLEFK